MERIALVIIILELEPGNASNSYKIENGDT